jgi:cytochrome c oxidase accessory protein FixG
MFDEHTMLVTYEAWRGEPRAHAKAGQSPEGRGHCIDCGLCVRVCPTGIDIRSGQQLDCIGCGLCIDACNSVMAKMGWPKELITYDSLSNQAAREAGKPVRARLIRPRTLIYLALLLIVGSVMLFFLSTRAQLEVTVQPDRAPLFVQLRDGGIQNAYTLKILNKERTQQTYAVAVDGLPEAQLSVIGYEAGSGGYALPVAGDDVGTFRVLLRAAANATRENPLHVEFVVRNRTSGETNEHETVFNGPSS